MPSMSGKAISGFIERRLVNRNFAKLWYGQAISSVGDYVFNTTLTLWIATKLGSGKSWAPLAISGLLISATVAIVVVGPIAGVWVDRWDRKTTMLRSESVRTLLAGGLAVVCLLPQHDLPVWAWLVLVYVLVFALNAAGRFFGPAQMVTISRVVPGMEQQTKAFGIVNATTAVARMIGPPVAAPLLFASGVSWALGLNAASYAVSYLAIRSLDLPPAEAATAGAVAERAFRRDLMEGLQFLVRSRVVFGVLIWSMLCQVGVGALNTLDVFFVTENLHVAPKDYGYMAVAMGIGLVFGSLLAPRLVRQFGAARTTAAVLFSAGLVYMLYARQTSFAAGLVVLLLFEIPVGCLGTAMEPITLAAIPQRLYARVMSSFGTLNQGTLMISMAAWGWVASSSLRGFHANLFGLHLGSLDTMLSIAGIFIALGGVASMITLPSDEILSQLSESKVPTASSTVEPDPVA